MAISNPTTSKRTAISENAYSDLDLHFKKHPQTGDVVVRKDADAVKRAVRNIILTNNYERPFKPGFGGSIRNLLFELNTDRKLRKAKNRIVNMIETFEPRVTAVQVHIRDVDINQVNLQVNYAIINGVSNQSLDLTVTRAR